MLKRISITLTTLALIVNLTLAASCGAGGGSIAALRAALRLSPTLTAPLVQSGVITQAQADGVVKDFIDGGEIALGLKQELDAISKTAPNLKQLQAAAVHRAYAG